MHRYLVVESHDPFEAELSAEFFDLALTLAQAENDVAVLFVGDGVNAALAGRHSFWLAELRRAGVALYAEASALAARGVSAAALSAGVRVTRGSEDLRAGRKPLWVADPAARRAA